MRKPSSQTAKQLTISILKDLELYERYATLRNDRSMVQHFQECWCMVFTHLYGGYTVPRVPATRRPEPSGIEVPASKPQWQINKYSRPARKVVAQVRERQRYGQRRDSFTVIYDVLTCGHKLLAAYRDDGSMHSKWRYCNECEPKTSTASSDGTMDSAAA
jgi:hypothetical protein